MLLTGLAARDPIIEGVRTNDTVVIVGETGSGKTTREYGCYLIS